MARLRSVAGLAGLWVLLAFVAWGCSGSDDADQPAAALLASDFQVVSANFSEVRPRKRIPQEHTCYGENVSPPLSWSNAPPGTRSLAMIADEPENDAGPWAHWVLYNIPAAVTELAQGIPTTTGELPDGTRQGTNDYKGPGYSGPCPAPLSMAQGGFDNSIRGDHIPPSLYNFRLYALDSMVDLPAGASRGELESAIEGHVLAQADTAGKYTTTLGLSFKQGAGFLDTTAGEKSEVKLTPTPAGEKIYNSLGDLVTPTPAGGR